MEKPLHFAVGVYCGPAARRAVGRGSWSPRSQKRDMGRPADVYIWACYVSPLMVAEVWMQVGKMRKAR